MRVAPLLVALVAAGPAAGQVTGAPTSPVRVLATAPFQNPAILESSGVAASRRTPGLLWTHNDSGNDPVLFAIDSAGAELGTVLVTGAENIDWEDLAAGPCPQGTCLFVADVGDNGARRPWVSVYRVSEPDPPGAGRRGATAAAEVIRLRWPGGPRDVEAMVVDAADRLYFISKPRRGLPRLYRVAAPRWGGADPIVPEDLGPLPLDPRGRVGRLVTGAALSPDGTRLAVRTYVDLLLFPMGDDGRPLPTPVAACDLLGLEAQGEGVAWLDHRRLALTSERRGTRAGGIILVECATP